MLAKLGERVTAVFRATAPDPFVLAILLTAATYILSIAFGDGFEPGRSRALQALDWWQGGFWKLLAFGMQMCLILVTGHALAESKPVARVLRSVARLPRSGRQAVALTAFVSILAGLVNWGLGLIVGAVLARDVGRAMRDRNVAVPYPLLCAAGYTSLLCWHGGLSGSAPLQAADFAQFKSLVGAPLADRIGELPTTLTLFSSLNLVVTGGMALLIPLVLALMCPKAGPADESAEPAFPPPARLERRSPARTLPEWLDRSPAVVWLLAAPALVWLAVKFGTDGLNALTLDTANLAFLALGLILHGSATRYMDAAADGARGCAGIIIQFPLYAGIMELMRASGLGAEVSRWFVGAAGGSEGGLSVMTFLSAGLVNLFVPSGGGQWAIQGPITMQAAVDAGVHPGRLVMAVAYGDEWTNMIQPFWALPLLGITGVKARDIVGYTFVAMVVAGVWITAWIWLG